MSKIALNNAKSLLDGRDISGILNNITLDYGINVEETSVFGDNTVVNTPTIKTYSASQSGFWDALSDADFFNAIDTFDDTLLAAFAAEGGTIGDVGYFAPVLITANNPSGAHGEVLKFSVDYASKGDLLRGTVMENGVFAATGAGTNRALGAVSATQSLFGQLHVTAAAGATPTLDVVVESDADGVFGSPLTRLTFPQFTSSVGADAQNVVGPITDTFYRANFTITGAGASYTVFLLLAIALT